MAHQGFVAKKQPDGNFLITMPWSLSLSPIRMLDLVTVLAAAIELDLTNQPAKSGGLEQLIDAECRVGAWRLLSQRVAELEKQMSTVNSGLTNLQAADQRILGLVQKAIDALKAAANTVSNPPPSTGDDDTAVQAEADKINSVADGLQTELDAIAANPAPVIPPAPANPGTPDQPPVNQNTGVAAQISQPAAGTAAAATINPVENQSLKFTNGVLTNGGGFTVYQYTGDHSLPIDPAVNPSAGLWGGQAVYIATADKVPGDINGANLNFSVIRQ